MKGLVPVMVDYTKPGQNEDLQTRFGVKGYPTTIFLGANGEKVADLGGRAAAQVKSQVEDIIRQHSRPTFVTTETVEQGLARARETGKLLGVLFADEREPDAGPVMDLILDQSMAQLREQFVWLKRPVHGDKNKATDEAKALSISKAAVVLLDPWGEDKARVLKKVTAFKGLKKDVEKAVDAARRAGHPPAPGSTPPAGSEAAPPASGDEGKKEEEGGGQ